MTGRNLSGVKCYMIMCVIRSRHLYNSSSLVYSIYETCLNTVHMELLIMGQLPNKHAHITVTGSRSVGPTIVAIERILITLYSL